MLLGKQILQVSPMILFVLLLKQSHLVIRLVLLQAVWFSQGLAKSREFEQILFAATAEENRPKKNLILHQCC